jgi:hypothetical protein
MRRKGIRAALRSAAEALVAIVAFAIMLALMPRSPGMTDN